MASENIPYKDALYGQWVTNFATVAAANATTLGLTTGQTTALTALAAAFNTTYAASQVSKVTTKGKVAAKDNARAASDQLFRSTARLVGANANVPDQLKADLGLRVTPNPSGPVTAPYGLVVDGYSNGELILAWNRNGNAKGTTFLIETRPDDATEYTIIGTSTSAKYARTGQAAGIKTWYRVRAQRGKVVGPPSDPVAAYGDATSNVISLSKAA